MLKFLFLIICVQQFVTAEPKYKYLLSYPLRANWSEALIACEKQGYELVSIETKEKEHEIEEVVRDANSDRIFYSWLDQIWTSGTKLNGTTEFIWKTTGNNITYTKWGSGEPSGRDESLDEDENCIALSHHNQTSIEWNDTICSYEYFYLCQKK